MLIICLNLAQFGPDAEVSELTVILFESYAWFCQTFNRKMVAVFGS